MFAGKSVAIELVISEKSVVIVVGDVVFSGKSVAIELVTLLSELVIFEKAVVIIDVVAL